MTLSESLSLTHVLDFDVIFWNVLHCRQSRFNLLKMWNWPVVVFDCCLICGDILACLNVYCTFNKTGGDDDDDDNDNSDDHDKSDNNDCDTNGHAPWIGGKADYMIQNVKMWTFTQSNAYSYLTVC